MKRLAKFLTPLVFWLAVWQLAALGVNQALLLPTPWAVCTRLGELAATEEFWLVALQSLLRVFGGLLAGVLLGTVLAWLTHFVTLADWILSPVIRLVRATPVASFILLLWLWVAAGLVPGVISALMVLPVVWQNVAQGLRETDPQLLELCRHYGFSAGKIARLVYGPSSLPYFASGARTALGLAWKAGVAAEALCLPKYALGSQIYFSKYYLNTADLFAWTAAVVALSLLLEWGLGHALDRLRGVKRRG